MYAATGPTAMLMIAVDMDGTLLGDDGKVSPRNLAAVLAAEAAGVEVVVATGRRHSYAMHILRPLGLHPASALVSSNGAVTRTLGSPGRGAPGADSPSATPFVGSRLIARSYLPNATALWLCAHVEEFRNALVLTFDRVGPDGEDIRGALVVEHLDELNASIGRWMQVNEPYIAHIQPIERALADGPDADAPIQMMLCGTIERMARAEACLLEYPGVCASGHPSGRSGAKSATVSSPGASSSNASEGEHQITLHRTEYPGRDLSILDILPAGCSKGAAVLRLAAAQGIDAGQIMAIGDNWNDVSMLDIAANSVLMENAPEDLKVFARAQGWRLGSSNRDDGVADAIESMLTVAC